MQSESVDETISNLPFNDAVKLRDQLSKEIIVKREENNLRVLVRVPAAYRESFEATKAWAYENGYIKKPSNYAFTKFALLNTIRMVIDEMEIKRNAPPEPPDVPADQEEPIIS